MNLSKRGHVLPLLGHVGLHGPPFLQITLEWEFAATAGICTLSLAGREPEGVTGGQDKDNDEKEGDDSGGNKSH
jgi:hypothetical protein